MKMPSLLGGRSKKGQAVIPAPVLAGVGAVFGLFLIGIFVFAFVLAGAEMKNVTTDDDAIGVINDTIDGAASFANFSPTLWIITGIGVLLGLLIAFLGGFFLFNRR